MKKLATFLALISFAIILIFSCKKDKDETTLPTGNGSINSLRTTVTGIVLDESNAPLIGVSVNAYGQTTTTSQHGTFVLKNINVNKERCVVQFSKTGFFKRSHSFIASANKMNYVRIVLSGNAVTHAFSSSATATLTLGDGSSAVFPANSFVTTNGTAYNGTVSLAMNHLSPDNSNFGFMIPGGDLAGVNVSNENVALYTYGMLGVELTGSSGELLQLANGSTAALTFPIAASQLATAPATIPLWYFDETASLWKEEGTATKAGNNYVGTVSHFSWWNCDYAAERATLKGKVIDCEGNGVPNIIVSVNTFWTLTTDQNGEYQNWVPASLALTVQVLTNYNPWLPQDSQLENVPALAGTQTYTVPDFVVSCQTKVAGTVQTCTGQNTNAYVTVSNGTFFNYQYSANGSFSIPVIPNTQLELNAYYSNTTHHQTITSLSIPLTLNAGTIMLCDSVSSTANNFTINGGPFSNRLFNITPTNAVGNVDLATDIFITGNSNPYSVDMTEFEIFGTSPGTYMGYLTITLVNTVDQTEYWLIEDLGPTGTFTITQVDTVGGRIKGHFSTSCSIWNDISNDFGTVSGDFDVLNVD